MGVYGWNHPHLAIGGMRDHAHLMLSLPATISIAKAVQLIKAGSSLWKNSQKRRKWFEWQEEYGAFTIGVAQKEVTIVISAIRRSIMPGRVLTMNSR